MRSGRCFNCLKNNHKSKDCSSQRNCRRCHNRHHQSICETHLSSSTTPQEPTETSSNLSNTTAPQDVTSTTGTANHHAKGKSTVLLQTAQAIASNSCSQLSRPVRILFDNGSQRSYITKNLCTQLKSKPIHKERLHLNTFGDNILSSQLREVYKLSLHKPGSTTKLDIVAIGFPIICSSLPAPVNLSTFPHLEGLEFADSPDSHHRNIYVLIGSDFYWSISGWH